MSLTDHRWEASALQWRITHGEPEMADEWLFRMVCNLVEDKPLSDGDRAILIGVLLTPALQNQGARLFNKMKMPDKRRNVTGKMRLYFTVEHYRGKGEERTEALEFAATDCGYLEGCKTEEDKDDPLRHASNDYKEAQKQFQEYLEKSMEELKNYPPPAAGVK